MTSDGSVQSCSAAIYSNKDILSKSDCPCDVDSTFNIHVIRVKLAHKVMFHPGMFFVEY